MEPTRDEEFVLGIVPGAMPGKWVRAWGERMPRLPLRLEQLDVASQLEALRDGRVDAALVRLPIDKTDLHVIPLYDEIAVVVMGVDDELTLTDEVSAADLAGYTHIVAQDDVLGLDLVGTLAPSFTAPVDTAAAIELAAAGVGVVVVPMSLARLHHRRDVTFRPLHEGPPSPVALAWMRERTTPAVETFVGIVRGRTARSSRN